jgi:hypothetical protein
MGIIGCSLGPLNFRGFKMEKKAANRLKIGSVKYIKRIFTNIFRLVEQPYPTQISSRAKFSKNPHVEGQNLDFFSKI